jgi:hypothetical protein
LQPQCLRREFFALRILALHLGLVGLSKEIINNLFEQLAVDHAPVQVVYALSEELPSQISICIYGPVLAD